MGGGVRSPRAPGGVLPAPVATSSTSPAISPGSSSATNPCRALPISYGGELRQTSSKRSMLHR